MHDEKFWDIKINHSFFILFINIQQTQKHANIYMPRDDSENLGNGPAFACARNVLTVYFAYVDSSNLCRKLHKFSSFITCISSSLKYSYIHETCMKHRPRNMGKQITIIDTFSVLCFASSFIQNNIISSCIQFPM